MEIRSAKESDYEQLMQLYNNFVGDDRYSKHDSDSFEEVLNSPNNFVFVAEDNGQIIGLAAFSVRNVIRYPKQIAELDELFVSQEYRQKGVGKLLMQKVEEKAKELNCYRLYVESQYKHETAHKFYEQLGYTNYGYHFIKNL